MHEMRRSPSLRALRLSADIRSRCACGSPAQSADRPVGGPAVLSARLHPAGAMRAGSSAGREVRAMSASSRPSTRHAELEDTMSDPATERAGCCLVPDDEPASLVRLSAEAAAAFIRGDMDAYAAFVRHTSDDTLMAPFASPPTRGFRRIARTSGATSTLFPGRTGETGAGAVLCDARHGRHRGDRAATRTSRPPSRAGLVAAGDAGLPPRRPGMAAGAPPRRPAGPRDQPRARRRDRPRQIRR